MPGTGRRLPHSLGCCVFTAEGGSSSWPAHDLAIGLTNVTLPVDTASLKSGFDALGRLMQRLDVQGTPVYQYAVLGNGQRTFTEDGPWASDEVTVTNRYGRRAGLRLAQPSGDFAV